MIVRFTAPALAGRYTKNSAIGDASDDTGLSGHQPHLDHARGRDWTRDPSPVGVTPNLRHPGSCLI